MSSQSRKTASRSVTETEKGTHTFEIDGYAMQKGCGVGMSVRSETFSVGGYDWAIRFYPDGSAEATKQYATAFLELVTKNAVVRARYVLRFVGHHHPPTSPLARVVQMRMMPWYSEAAASLQAPVLFRYSDSARFGWHRSAHMPRSVLEQGMMPGVGYYIRDDRLTIECQLTVIGNSSLSGAISVEKSEIEVPPFDIMDHFGNLLLQKEGTDVTIVVAGHSFEAHKIVLAARSPVFKAEFLGQMRESGTHSVTVEDMQPDVFSALLHFIYNDSLPDMSDLERNDYSEMMRHLLVAADRYAMERLKVICQGIVGKNLNVDNVSTALALADQHHCDKLRDECFEFITSSSESLDAVKVTQGYANLKRTCPSVFVELFEKASKKLHRT